MNNPNVTPDETQTVSVPARVEESAPRNYIVAGVIAAVLIVLACLGVAIVLSNAVVAPPPNPTPGPGGTAQIKVIGTIIPNSPFAVRGTGFGPNEHVEVFVALTAGAPFSQFVKVGDTQTGSDGSFDLTGLNLPAAAGNTVYIIARGAVSGFTPITPVTIGGATPALSTTPTATGQTVTLSPTPVEPPTVTPTPTPLLPTDTPTASPTPDPNAVGIWFGRYYDNPDLADPPAYTSSSPNLCFNWGSGSPNPSIPVDNFSISWTRNENFKTTDNYVFTLTVDDGARVYLDGVLFINEWHNGGPRTVSAGVPVTRGMHQIRVDYYEATGNAQICVTWAVKYFGWVGRYYNSPNLDGPIVLKRDDAAISFDWGYGSPAPEVNPDNFSVDWTRSVNFPVAATYVFTAVVDDGVRIFIDAKPTPVLDNFSSTGSRTITGTITLSAGSHAMEVQYVERTGEAKIDVTWAALVPAPPPPTPPSATTNAANNLTASSALLNGSVNARGSSTTITFQWGPSSGTYPNTIAATPGTAGGSANTPVSAALTGLASNTAYYYRVVAANAGGTTYGGEQSFTTLASVPPNATTDPPSSVTATGATLNGTVNANNSSTTVTFEWGTSSGTYPNSVAATPGTASGTSDTAVNTALAGLAHNTTYYYRVVAANSAGTTYGSEQSFTTSAIPPSATTNAATNVTSTTIMLKGTVNANNASTTVTFEWGVSSGTYPNTLAASPDTANGTGATVVSATLTGLTPNTTYYYRVVAANSAGTTNGNEQNVKTPAPPSATTNPAENVISTTATLSATINANGINTAVAFEWGTSSGVYTHTLAATPGTVHGTSDTVVHAELTGLAPSTPYYYRVVAVNSAGTADGSEQTFTTPP